MSAEPLDGGITESSRRTRTSLAPVRTVPPPAAPDVGPPGPGTADAGAPTAAIPTGAVRAAAAGRPVPLRPMTVSPPEPAGDTPPRPLPDGDPTLVRRRAPRSGPVPSPTPRHAPASPRSPVRGSSPDPTPPRPDARPSPDAPSVPEAGSVESRVAEAVRTRWALVEPRIDEVADWFAALLFSLAPATRALFPTRVTPSARRLLRSMLLPMTTLDRPSELAGALEPLVAEHRGLGLAPDQYEAIGVALVGAMRRFADGWDEVAERDWVQAFALVAGPLEDVLAAQSTPAVVGASVVEHHRIGWDLAIITLVPHAPVTYRAGQHVPVEIPGRPRMWRPLSPATAPRADGRLEFHVRAVDGGWVSRAMVAHTRVGEVWNIGPARGRLELDATSPRDVLMVAGGTGVAPMLALCEELATRPAPPVVTVLVGGRTAEDLYAAERLADLERRCDWLAVAGVCEDDPLSQDTIPGLLPDAVVRTGDWSDHDILLAGSPGMIRATVSALLVEGVGLDRIRYDPFTE